MPETSVLEDTVTSVRALYDAICREADADALRSEDEAALIARVGEKLAELQARVRASREGAGPGAAPEGASPERDQWESWAHVAGKLARLSDALYAQEHPLADALGAMLDQVAVAEAKGDYPLATQTLTGEALALVETHDLWAAVEPGPGDDAGNLLPEPTRRQIEKLRDLRRVLSSRGHPDAGDFAALVDRIPETVDDVTQIIPASRAAEEAWAYADAQALWDMLAKADEEAMFWEHNGERYRRMQNLMRSLDEAGHDEARPLQVRLEAVDAQIQAEGFHLAAIKLDEAWDFARDKGVIEEGPKDAWRRLHEDVAALEALKAAALEQHWHREGGFPPAATLARYVDAMQAAAADMDWQGALDQYHAGRAYADAQGLWDEIGIEAPEDDEAADEDGDGKGRWLKWAFLHDRMRDLYACLVKRDHPLADRLGAYLDEIDEARQGQDFHRAADLLVTEAGGFVEDHDLWQIAEAGDGENLLPEITQGLIVRLADLSRALSDIGHDQAAAFDSLVSAIPRVVTEFSGIIPAGRAVEEAWAFADAQALWSAVPTLPKAEEERLFWENSGTLYRDLQALQRRLEEAGHADAGALTAALAAADREIGWGNFMTAGILLGDAGTLADERGLWDAVPEIGGGDGGFSPMLATIGGSVGRGGRNDPADVLVVQRLLNQQGAALGEDGDCGSKTVRAIEAFQTAEFGRADGRVDPDGRTMAALTGRAVIDDVADSAVDVAKTVTKSVTKTVGAVADALGDALDDAGDFLGGFFGAEGSSGR